MPKFKVKGQTFQTGELGHTDKQTEGHTEGHYQVHYLPASRSIMNDGTDGPLEVSSI